MIIYRRKEQIPIDKGYAWVILVCSFFCLFIASLPFINGIFQVVFVEVFQQDSFTTSWILSVSNSLGCMGGPLASLMLDKLGSRLTVIFGGLLGSIGFLCSAFSYSFLQIAISYGLLVGLGVAIVYTPCSVIVGYYFERYRNISFGIINVAVGLCTMVMAPAVTAANDYYGWRGTMLILAGLYLQTVWLGCLLRPVILNASTEMVQEAVPGTQKECYSLTDLDSPGQLEMAAVPEEEEEDEEDRTPYRKFRSVTVSAIGQKSTMIDTLPSDDKIMFVGSRLTLSSIGSNYSKTSRRAPSVVAGPNGSILDLQKSFETSSTEGSIAGGLTPNRYSSVSMRRTASWASRTGAMADAARGTGSFRLRPRSISETIHETRLPEEDNMIEIKLTMVSDSQSQNIPDTESQGKGCKNVLSSILPTALFFNRSYMTYMYVALFINLGNSTGYQHFLYYAVSHGTSADACALLLSLTGVSNMLSRFLSGLVANGDPFPLRVIHFSTIGITGIIFLFTPLLIKTYAGQVVFSLCFGFYANCFIPVIGSIIIQFVGLEYLSTAFGWLIFFHGLGNLLGPPIAGRLYDITNDYCYSFILGGLFYLAGSMLMMTTSLTKHGTAVINDKECKDNLNNDP